MCGVGFVLVCGRKSKEKCQDLLCLLLKELTPRGPDVQRSDIISTYPDYSMGYVSTTLHMSGKSITSQPIIREGSIIFWAGEVFGNLCIPKDVCDTTVFLPLILDIADDAYSRGLDIAEELANRLSEIEAPFAFILYHKPSNTIYFSKDPVGRRSLLFAQSIDGEVLITSQASFTSLQKNWTVRELAPIGIYTLSLHPSDTHSIFNGSFYNVKCAPYPSFEKRNHIIHKDIPILDDSIPPLESPLLVNAVESCISALSEAVRVRVDAVQPPPIDEACTLDHGESILFPCNDLKEASSVPSVDALLLKLSDVGVTEYGLPGDPILFVQRLLKMRSDQVRAVPHICVLFSGGLDSMLMARLAHCHRPISEPIVLVSVCFAAQSDASPSPDRLAAKRGLQELQRVCPGREFIFIQANHSFAGAVSAAQATVGALWPRVTQMDFNIGSALAAAARGVGFVDLLVDFERLSMCSDTGQDPGKQAFLRPAHVRLAPAEEPSSKLRHLRYGTENIDGPCSQRYSSFNAKAVDPSSVRLPGDALVESLASKYGWSVHDMEEELAAHVFSITNGNPWGLEGDALEAARFERLMSQARYEAEQFLQKYEYVSIDDVDIDEIKAVMLSKRIESTNLADPVPGNIRDQACDPSNRLSDENCKKEDGEITKANSSTKPERVGSKRCIGEHGEFPPAATSNCPRQLCRVCCRQVADMEELPQSSLRAFSTPPNSAHTISQDELFVQLRGPGGARLGDLRAHHPSFAVSGVFDLWNSADSVDEFAMLGRLIFVPPELLLPVCRAHSPWASQKRLASAIFQSSSSLSKVKNQLVDNEKIEMGQQSDSISVPSFFASFFKANPQYIYLSADSEVPSSNSCVSSIVSVKIRVLIRSPARALLSGLGADELFGGYARHRTAFQVGGWASLWHELELDRCRLWDRNLGRDDRLMSRFGREARFPFLDSRLLQWRFTLPLPLLCDMRLGLGEGDKRILRLAARALGLRSSSGLVKRAIHFGSRIAKQSNIAVFGSNAKGDGDSSLEWFLNFSKDHGNAKDNSEEE